MRAKEREDERERGVVNKSKRERRLKIKEW